MIDAEPYLTRLTTRLIEGIERLPAEPRATCEILARSSEPRRRLSGREGGSDLYYTGFARSLAVLQCSIPNSEAAGFLRHKMTGSAGVVDFFSLVVS